MGPTCKYCRRALRVILVTEPAPALPRQPVFNKPGPARVCDRCDLFPIMRTRAADG